MDGQINVTYQQINNMLSLVSTGFGLLLQNNVKISVFLSD